jgi:hypothetical protein
MQIQYVSKYIALSEEGLVPRLECPMDQGSLFANMNLEDEIYLYCLSCDYKNTIGTEVYNRIMNSLNGVI